MRELLALALLAGASFVCCGPVAILAVDPQRYPYGANGVSCGRGAWCPESFVCGASSTPSCLPGECCPAGGAFGVEGRRVPTREADASTKEP